MFKIGEKVSYGSHGLAEVIEVRGDGHYALKHLKSSTRLIVPKDSESLRALMTKEEVEDVYRIFKQKKSKVDSRHRWKRLNRSNLSDIRSGSPFLTAGILRDLRALKKEKELSFGEYKMLEQAEELLKSEICAVKGISSEMFYSEVETALN